MEPGSAAESPQLAEPTAPIAALPEELLRRLCLFLEGADVMRLCSAERRLHQVCRADAIWRLMLARKLCRRAPLSADGFLGEGFFRLFRQESFGRDIAKVGQTLEFNPISPLQGLGHIERIAFAGPQAEDQLLVFFDDGSVAAHSLALEGRLLWTADTRNQARVLAEDAARIQRRLDLSAPHKNRLLQLRINGALQEGSGTSHGFCLWDDDDEGRDGTDPQSTVGAEPRRLASAPSALRAQAADLERCNSDASDASLTASEPPSPLFATRTTRSSSASSSVISHPSCTSGNSDCDLSVDSHPERHSSLPSERSDAIASARGRRRKSASSSRGGRGRGRSAQAASCAGSAAIRPKPSRRRRHRRGEAPLVFRCCDAARLAVVASLDLCHASLTNASTSVVDDGSACMHLLRANRAGTLQARLVPPRWCIGPRTPLTSVAIAREQGVRAWTFGGRAFAGPSAREGRPATAATKDAAQNAELLLATGHADGSIAFWGRDGTLISAVHQPERSVATALLVDRGFAASGHANGALLTWQPASAKRLSMARPPPKSAVHFLLRVESLLIAATEMGEVCVYERSGRQLTRWQTPHNSLRCLRARVVHPGLAVVATAGDDGAILLRRLETSTTRLGVVVVSASTPCTLAGHSGRVNDLYVDDHRVVSCGDDGTIRVWAVDGVGDLEGRSVRTLKWKRSNRLAITALLVGSSLLAGLRSDGSVVAFTFLSAWSDVAPLRRAPVGASRIAAAASSGALAPAVVSLPLDEPRSTPTGAPAGTTLAVGADSNVPVTPGLLASGKKKKKSCGLRRKTPSSGGRRFRVQPQHDELVAMRFDDVFDAYDLQEMHDFHNGF